MGIRYAVGTVGVVEWISKMDIVLNLNSKT